jgi:hypothetical protein
MILSCVMLVRVTHGRLPGLNEYVDVHQLESQLYKFGNKNDVLRHKSARFDGILRYTINMPPDSTTRRASFAPSIYI